MATILLGTTSPKSPPPGTSTSVNGESVEAPQDPNLPDQTVVLIETPDTDFDGVAVPLDKKLTEVRNAFVLHSGEGAAWVEGQDEDFVKNVSQVFNCKVGRPSNWSEKPQEPISEPSQAQGTDLIKDVNVKAENAGESA